MPRNPFRRSPQAQRPQTIHQHDALTNAISRVLTPVMICMILAVWFVNGHGDPQRCNYTPERRYNDEIYDRPESRVEESSGNDNIIAIAFMAVFFGLMVIFTFLIVWLYKTNRTKIINGWLITAVFVIFGYIGGLYVFDFCRSFCINLDWISLVIAVWNFTITGLFAVFSSVPRVINQAYLVIMSALMAFVFRPLPSWTIWTVLAGLVLWDLYAVLGPGGPLKKLVAIARERGDDLPALVYDTNPRDAGREVPKSQSSPPKPSREPEPPRRVEGGAQPAPPAEQAQQIDVLSPSDVSESPQVSKPAYIRRKILRKPTNRPSTATPPTPPASAAPPSTLPNVTTVEEPKEEVPVGTLGTHLKLGLGDFVFYSILVAEASKTGVMTAVTSFIAILAGLCATLFLVTVCRKALPALPISITAGLLSYLLTRYTLQPFTANLFDELLFH
ncbi:Presenilin [Gracilaria domingensis]|nr:Presenilin [Gracilaria domingensis]